jgi:small subunit ribosomal protein S1
MDNEDAHPGRPEDRSPQEPIDVTPEADSARESVGPAASVESEDQMALAEGRMPAVKPLAVGQIVDGLIVHIDEQGALVDVGTKSEGHIATGELSSGEEGKPLAVGDRVAVYVVRPEDEDGSPVLSKKRADYEFTWTRITKAHEQGEVLSAMVTDRVKGGLVVDLGLRGFLPASHVRTRNVHALDRFVGQSLKVKIIEVDRARKRVVVSQREAIEAGRRRRREKTLASLEENKVYRGIVRRITNYGAFVDIGGVDGLLHITEMSWTRINHPTDVVKVGDKIDVMVLRYDRDQNRISLGLKQILPDPWSEIESRLRVGQTVTGTVTRVVPFGAFVRLEGGIEGIVPNAELPGSRGQRAQDVLSSGESIQVKVVSIRAQERRMTLSLRQIEQARERRELKEYLAREEESSRVTIGDLFGSMLAESQATRQQDEGEAAEPAETSEAQQPKPEEAEAAAEAAGDEDVVLSEPAEEEPATEDMETEEAASEEVAVEDVAAEEDLPEAGEEPEGAAAEEQREAPVGE